MEKKVSKKLIGIRMNNLIANELYEVCNNIGISTTSFIEIAVIEKMAKLKAYSSENAEINKIYGFVQNIEKKGRLNAK